MSFWHLVRVVVARAWLIIGLALATLIVISVAGPKPKVAYEAACLLAPTPQAMRGGVASTARQTTPDRNVIMSNLILLAQSGEVFQRAMDYLAMDRAEQRRVMPDVGSWKRITRPMYSSGEALTFSKWSEVLDASAVVNPRLGNITSGGTTSDVIRLKVKMPNGDDAPFVANAVGVAFIQAYEDKSRQDVRRYIEFLEASKAEARRRLTDIESRIAAYKRDHKVVGVDEETRSGLAIIAGLESERNAAQALVDEATAALDDLDRQLDRQPLVRTDKLPAEMNPQVAKLKEELAAAETELSLAATRYKPEHTTYKALESRVKMIRERIAEEGESFGKPAINEIHNALLNQRSAAANRLAAANARLRAVSAQLAAARTKAASLGGMQTEMVALTREQQEATDEYTLFSQKLAESKIAEREFQKTGSIVPFDWSRSAVGPVVEGPRRRALALYGFMLSLVLGVALAVWLDSIDNRLRGASDAEQLLGIPTIGLIPAFRARNGQLPRLTHLYPLSAAAESYRILRTNILFAHRDKPFKTLMVASGKPGQGATTTICNLAIALAQIGKKVILIDADMRRPRLHEFFGLSNDAGLSALLQGRGNPLDSVCQTEIENLIIIPAGPVPLNPSELLASDRMWEIAQSLKEHCDIILFDTPSVVVFSDGAILASWLDSVLFVVSANQVPRGAENQAMDMLKKAKANFIGAVVNRMSPERVDSCFYYSRYYSGAGGEVAELPGGDGADSAVQDGSKGGPGKLEGRQNTRSAAETPGDVGGLQDEPPEGSGSGGPTDGGQISD